MPGWATLRVEDDWSGSAWNVLRRLRDVLGLGVFVPDLSVSCCAFRMQLSCTRDAQGQVGFDVGDVAAA